MLIYTLYAIWITALCYEMKYIILLIAVLLLLYIMTSSNGNIFGVTGHLCGAFPPERPVTRSFDIFFDLRLNKRLSKQSWGWWFETLSCPLWRNCNDTYFPATPQKVMSWQATRALFHWQILEKQTPGLWHDQWPLLLTWFTFNPSMEK